MAEIIILPSTHISRGSTLEAFLASQLSQPPLGGDMTGGEGDEGSEVT